MPCGVEALGENGPYDERQNRLKAYTARCWFAPADIWPAFRGVRMLPLDKTGLIFSSKPHS